MEHIRKLGQRITISKVADDIGYDRSYLSEVERGVRNASAELTELLAAYYDCSTDELTGEKKDKPQQPKKKSGTGPSPSRKNDTKSPNRATDQTEAVA